MSDVDQVARLNVADLSVWRLERPLNHQLAHAVATLEEDLKEVAGLIRACSLEGRHLPFRHANVRGNRVGVPSELILNEGIDIEKSKGEPTPVHRFVLSRISLSSFIVRQFVGSIVSLARDFKHFTLVSEILDVATSPQIFEAADPPSNGSGIFIRDH